MHMRKLTALTLALAVLVLCVPGALALPDPLTQETRTIVIGTKMNTKVSDYENNYLTKFLEKTLNVKIEWVFFPDGSRQARQKFDQMVATNQRLPDILLDVGLTDEAVLRYGESGVLLPLNEYIGEYGVNLAAGFEKWCTAEEKENVFKYNTAANGKIYAFPFYYVDPNNLFCRGLWVNKTWTEKLGMELPATTDELYDLLVAFRDRDPNGNGIRDEIPLVGTTGWSGNVVQTLLNSFIYYSDYCLNAENGTLSTPFTEDAFREGLRYVHRLVEENLLSPLSFTQGNSELKEIIENGEDREPVVGCFSVHSDEVTNPMSRKILDFTGIAPLTGPEGVAYTSAGVIKGKNTTYITRDAQDPVLAFRFLDALCDTEISISVRFGELGVDWFWADENSVCKQKLPGYKAIYKSDNLVWSSESTDKIWHIDTCTFMPPKLFGGLAYQDEYFTYDEETKRSVDTWWESVPKRHGKCPAEVVGPIMYTQEEMEEIGETWSTIQDYVQDSTLRFATGDLSIEQDWDAYLNDLKMMGLEHFLEIAQNAYTRMNSYHY